MKIIDVIFIEKSTESLFFMVTLSYKKWFKKVEKTERYYLSYHKNGYSPFACSCVDYKTPFEINTALVQLMILEYERANK